MNVVLTGVIGDRFGQHYSFAGNSPRKCVSALMNQLKGFEDYVRSRSFNLWVDDKNISEEQIINNYTENSTLYIGLHVDGASGKMAGALMVVAGVALIAFTYWNPAGWTAGTQMMAYGLGAGIAMSGAASLLMPTASPSDTDDNKASYGFSSLTTTTEQGNPVPILYGKGLIGGFVIMYRITTQDTNGY